MALACDVDGLPAKFLSLQIESLDFTTSINLVAAHLVDGFEFKMALQWLLKPRFWLIGCSEKDNERPLIQK